jgi:N-acetylmuramoyl-L-alanine amidase
MDPEGGSVGWLKAMRRVPLTRRDTLQLLACVPLALCLPSGLLRAATVRLLAMREWLEDPENKRLVLDLDAEARFGTRLLENPPRLLLSIRDAELEEPLQRRFSDAVLRAIAAARGDAGVEVVLEMAPGARADVFYQPPSGGRGHRIVIDIAPALSAGEQARREAQVRAVRDSGDKIVAIDPGHGGEDPGTVHGRLREKHIALSVAHALATQLSSRAGLRPVLTRRGDYFVPLHRRQAIARQYGAHLFVSLHVNAAPTKARGAEVFFLSLQGSEDKAARELVDRENAADLVGGVPPDQVNAPIVDILMDMTRNHTMQDSERLAEVLLERLGRVQGGTVRGVKQGPLAVLKSIDKPSVLVELGFITSGDDRSLLGDAGTHRAYARHLADGIAAYLG